MISTTLSMLRHCSGPKNHVVMFACRYIVSFLSLSLFYLCHHFSHGLHQGLDWSWGVDGSFGQGTPRSIWYQVYRSHLQSVSFVLLVARFERLDEINKTFPYGELTDQYRLYHVSPISNNRYLQETRKVRSELVRMPNKSSLHPLPIILPLPLRYPLYHISIITSGCYLFLTIMMSRCLLEM